MSGDTKMHQRLPAIIYNKYGKGLVSETLWIWISALSLFWCVQKNLNKMHLLFPNDEWRTELEIVEFAWAAIGN